MKASKGLFLFCFLAIFVSACFNPPEFSIRPEIQYQKVQFKETPLPGDADSLILFLSFKDGDGDLGLGHLGSDLDPYVESQYESDPYQASIFYLANGSGDTLRAVTTVAFHGTKTYDLLLPKGVIGKLATDKTRSLPNYGYLPVYDPNVCINYQLNDLLVKESDNVIDGTYNVIDTINAQSGRYFVVREPLLYKINPNNYNIDVKFLVFENGDYVEYNWFENYCIDFNGRFPILSNKSAAPLEGTIRYSMENTSFLAIFGSKKLKLRVRIRDRALNNSKEIETEDFDLRSIQVN